MATPEDPIHLKIDHPFHMGLISDIHGNYPALEAVLEAMPTVDELVCLGDIIGYGPEPKRCLDEVRNRASVIVQGNHERTLENPEWYQGHELAFAGLKVANEQLTNEDIDWALGLPETVFYTKDIVLCHSHPDPSRRDARLNDGTLSSLVAGYEQYGLDLVAFGHTHKQRGGKISDYARILPTRTDGWFVNPGSVGQPRDGDPHAAYALVTVDEGQLDIGLHRVKYDIDRVVRQIELNDLPARAAERLWEAQ